MFFFLIFVLFCSPIIFVECRIVVGSVEGGGLRFGCLFNYHFIVDYFQGIGWLGGEFVVGIHSGRVGTLTP